MLLLRDHGSHYERVRYVNMENEGFERRSTVDHLDSYRNRMLRLENEDTYLEPKEWWRRHFKKEKIIIG